VDDDVAGLTVTASEGTTTVTEGGSQDSLSVVLTAEPAGDVVLTVASSDPDEATVSAATLTFTPADWDTPQWVVVTGVADAVVDGNQDIMVTVAVDPAQSSDEFDAVTVGVATVTVVDNDQDADPAAGQSTNLGLSMTGTASLGPTVPARAARTRTAAPPGGST
jgi:hypothetical protein